jgi:hypothetical protein
MPGPKRGRPAKPNYQQQDAKATLMQQLAALEDNFKTQGYEDEYEDEVRPMVRAEILPPPKPEKTRFNPDQIVDIVTFIEHPYFCGLRPYPWQRLILKCFYMGQEGNTDLEIEDVPDEVRNSGTCDSCVWKYVRENEEKVYKGRQDGKQLRNVFSVTNSPCLTCDRFDEAVREARYEAAREEATNPDDARKIDGLIERPITDNYETERDLLFAPEFDPLLRKQVLEKCGNRYKFQELVLVLGRRSGKSFLVSVMALYELYRLLSMGHPQSRYGLMEFDEIVLLNVARNEEQAKKAIFSKIKQTVLASPFFQPYVGKDTELEMRFFTDHDRQENERRAEKGINLFAGSLVLRCGSSNASGLVGLTCWSIIMDEVAAMAGDNPDSGLDYALYDDLKPSGATFGKDFKMMMLSNPKGPIGLLYDLHENRQDDPTTLVMRLPTWLTNPSIDQDWLEEQKRKDPVEYQMQFGAEFGAASSDPMFTPEQVSNLWAMSSTTPRAEYGQPLIEYYLHLDPARTSDYYALAVAHTEQIYPVQIGPDNRPLRRVVIDHIHFWNPLTKNQPVAEKEVEDYVIDLHKRFRFKQVSFDQWHSQSSILRLKSMGINAIERQFNQEYKGKIYTELIQLMREQRIDIYGFSGGKYKDAKEQVRELNEIAEAKNQFTFLQKVWKSKRFEIKALSGYKDDICDAVAAVAYEALTAKVMQQLPKSRIARTGPR